MRTMIPSVVRLSRATTKTKQNKLEGAFSEPGAKTVIPRLVKGEWCFLFVLDPFLAPDLFVSCGGVVV